MKTKLAVVILLVAALAAAGYSQSVSITAKRVTYTRKKPIADYKKTFTINYPTVKAATQAVSKKIEASISYKSVLKLDLDEELNDIQWLEEADYEVGYNKNGILSISLSMEGSGAYPSATTKTVVVDLRTGARVRPADVFRDLSGLAAMIRKDQKKEIAAAIAEIKKDTEANESNPTSLFENANFKVADLEGFSVSDKGVTFTYDYGFPHIIQALQPDGLFFYAWARLKPYIKPGGLLARIAR